MTYLLAFAAMSNLLVHTALYHGKTIWKALVARVEEDDIHAKLMRVYREVPSWWYGVTLAMSFAAAIIYVEVSKRILEMMFELFYGCLNCVILTGMAYVLTCVGVRTIHRDSNNIPSPRFVYLCNDWIWCTPCHFASYPMISHSALP
jgi:hypothetical protein